jgi:glutathione S-transferase
MVRLIGIRSRDWVEGEVSFVDTQEIALLRHDPDVGRVAVHFPRLGYDWRRA